jgi:hypothetical protein
MSPGQFWRSNHGALTVRWFLLSLALAIGSAQSQGPAPSPAKGTEGSKTQAAKGQQKAKQDQRGTANVPLVVDVLRPKKSEAEAAQDAKDREDRAAEARFSLGFNFLLVLFNGILAVSTVLLWVVTSKVANAAKESANAAEKSIAIAREEFISTHRAWVGLSGPIETIKPLAFDEHGAKATIRIVGKNVGSSPSIGTSLVTRTTIGPFPIPDPREYARVPPESQVRLLAQMGLVILPGDPIPWDVEIFVSRNDFKQGKNGAVTVWLAGHVHYHDDFNLYASGFLFSYVPEGGNERGIMPTGVIRGVFKPSGIGWQTYSWPQKREDKRPSQGPGLGA